MSAGNHIFQTMDSEEPRGDKECKLEYAMTMNFVEDDTTKDHRVGGELKSSWECALTMDYVDNTYTIVK